jgi:monoamine oxidase
MDHSTVDVVVIGGGLAGLVAARSLVASGHEVALFEATGVVGGRTRAHAVGGTHVELGGTFVGPDHDRLLALAAAVGCTTHPTHDDGAHVMDVHGRRSSYRGALLPVGLRGLLGTGLLQVQLDRLARTVPSDRPWLAPHARRYDEMSLADWLRGKHATAVVRELFTLLARVTWGCEAHEVSFLHVLHTVRGSGGVGAVLATRGGAQQDHFVEGAAEISHRVAAALGDRVRLDAPVRSVDWSDDRVTVTTPRERVSARRVVVAVPPASRDRIVFSPALPHPWSAMGTLWPQGVLSKAYAVYERPFWRDGTGVGRSGAVPLSGQGQSLTGPVVVTFDASPPAAPGTVPHRGVLLGFVGGDPARAWDPLPADERRAQALASFASLFGPAALEPLDYVDERWAEEPWVTGGPTAAPRPGAWTGSGVALSTPVGPIHWAGTETALRTTGFMDGAVRSGEAAAAAAACV